MSLRVILRRLALDWSDYIPTLPCIRIIKVRPGRTSPENDQWGESSGISGAMIGYVTVSNNQDDRSWDCIDFSTRARKSNSEGREENLHGKLESSGTFDNVWTEYRNALRTSGSGTGMLSCLNVAYLEKDNKWLVIGQESWDMCAYTLLWNDSSSDLMIQVPTKGT